MVKRVQNGGSDRVRSKVTATLRLIGFLRLLKMEMNGGESGGPGVENFDKMFLLTNEMKIYLHGWSYLFLNYSLSH